MIRSTDPSKNVLKNPPKVHDEATQSNILWLNLNKINEISILQSTDNKVTPHFPFMRRAQYVDTHAHKQHRLSQNILPVCSSFVLVIASDMHLEPESEKRAENVDFHSQKYPDTTNTFSLFFKTFFIN